MYSKNEFGVINSRLAELDLYVKSLEFIAHLILVKVVKSSK